MEQFFSALGNEIEDAYEETFELFSQSRSLEDLGMINPTVEELEVSIRDRDFSIKQSIGALHSSRKGGTTGAAVWKSSAKFGEWLASPRNCLFEHGVLTPNSTMLELGSGVSGIVPCMLDRRVKSIVATDQPYALKILQENIDSNRKADAPAKRKDTSTSHRKKTAIQVTSLDWEADDVPSFLSTSGFPDGVDVVLASDTVYNYALLAPFTQTCIDICRVRERHRKEPSSSSSSGSSSSSADRPTVCVIVQLLRQSDVFEQWLTMLLETFRVWRVPGEMLEDGFRVESGFVVHVLVLRGQSET